MKRILLTLLTVATLGITATSCSKAGLVESAAYLVDVRYDDWRKDASLNYVYCPVDISTISGRVLNEGNVIVYVYDGNRQNPLPYIYPIPVTYDDGSSDIVGENLRYDIERGRVTLIMQDLDGFAPQITRENCPDMTFRIVVSAPAE